ncbi:MAG: T9SS type A sorting domain-containing protein [Bacteroidales bacterium]|nr:T9SS type A sorting domain-containing protein [Bacteroidales bacterium]
MKKIIFVTLAILCLATPTLAQDTIHQVHDTVTIFQYPRYAFNNIGTPPWFGRFDAGDLGNEDSSQWHRNRILYDQNVAGASSVYGHMSPYMYVRPADTIHGISVNLARYENCDEDDSLMIYVQYIDRDCNCWRILDSLKWTPDARKRWLRMWVVNREKDLYYLDTILWLYSMLPYDQLTYDQEFIVPMYELYFDEPLAIPDTIFIVGWLRGSGCTIYNQFVNALDDSVSYTVYASIENPPTIYFQPFTGSNQWTLYIPIKEPLAEWDTMAVHKDTVGGGGNPGDTPGGGQDTIGGGTEKVVQADGTLELKLFPNPTDGAVRIECRLPLEAVRVRDMRGCTVYEHKGDVPSLDTGRWPQGVYIVEATTQAGKIIKKLIVK